ncbi:transposase [Streptomyces sp. NPDC088817]|uniref:IS110 family transposase n=1 Tax=unclassified Streptomyces TaxID=2593676 RepID=UPI0036E3332E
MTGTEAADTRDQIAVGGVDSHADTIHVAVVTDRGRHLADAQFPTKAAGYAAAIAFLQAHGTVAAVGVEGTSSYGSGFTHAARRKPSTVGSDDVSHRLPWVVQSPCVTSRGGRWHPGTRQSVCPSER